MTVAVPRSALLMRAALIGALVAASLGRAALGADTEASVVFHPAFQAALLPAALVGAVGAGRFGSARGTDLVLALLTVIAALAAGCAAASLVVPDLRGLLLALGGQPMALAAVAAAFGLTQALAWRQARPPSSRR